MRKKITIKRINASALRPTTIKPFSIKKFMDAAANLERALKKEEKEYGGSSEISAQ